MLYKTWHHLLYTIVYHTDIYTHNLQFKLRYRSHYQIVQNFYWILYQCKHIDCCNITKLFYFYFTGEETFDLSTVLNEPVIVTLHSRNKPSAVSINAVFCFKVHSLYFELGYNNVLLLKILFQYPLVYSVSQMMFLDTWYGDGFSILIVSSHLNNIVMVRVCCTVSYTISVSQYTCCTVS